MSDDDHKQLADTIIRALGILRQVPITELSNILTTLFQSNHLTANAASKLNQVVVNLVNQQAFNPYIGLKNGQFTLLFVHLSLVKDLTTDFDAYLSREFSDKREVRTYDQVVNFFKNKIKTVLMTRQAEGNANYVLEVVYWLAGYFQAIDKAREKGGNTTIA